VITAATKFAATATTAAGVASVRGATRIAARHAGKNARAGVKYSLGNGLD
jgi:hypothetical protein